MRILFVTSNRIGDAVLSTGLLDHLIRRHPDARITVACGPVAEGVFIRMPRLERLILLEKRRYSLHWLPLWRSVAGTLWDLVVDIRASALGWLVPARRRVVMRRRDGHKIAQLAAILGLDPPPLPVIWTAPEDRAVAARLLPDGPPVIALGPTANWDGKVWPAERFVELYHRLVDGPMRGARVAVLAGPGAHERLLAAPVLAALPEAIDLCGRLSLPEAAACLARSALFIGNDFWGLMHLAAAAGTPTLGLFGPTPAEQYAPAGRRTAVALARGPAMADLSVEDALRAALSLVAVPEPGMTRIAQVMAGAAHGGAELFFERLCIALHRAGEAVLPVIRGNPERAALLRDAGLQPAELRFGTRLDLMTRPRLRRMLQAFRPEVVVGWMNRANLHMPAGDWVRVGRLGGYYDLRYYRGCDHLVGNTQGIVAWLRTQGWPEGRAHYLPNFVDDFADTAPADLPHDRPLLLALGRLHTDKGFDTLIRALARLPGVALAIAGTGPELAALQALARAEGVADRVEFLGWRRDAGALLKAADLFVCSSRVEPLGNMVIEAWSAGCPVVAVAADGPAELILHGEDGLLVPHEDAAALAEAIGGLLGAPAEGGALAAAGRRRFEAEFMQAPVVAQWQDFLAGLAGAR